MKPLKGMMRDVHPSKLIDGTYVDAINFVFGEHLDGLMQEAGFTNDSVVSSDVASYFSVVGGCGLVDDGVLLFCINDTGTTNYVVKVVGTVTTILSSGVFGFSREAVIDAVSFKTTSGDTYVIFTDDTNPPKYLNVDNLAVPTLINPTGNPIYIEENVSSTAAQGFFPAGTHYIAVAYAYEDGSALEYNNLHGPFYRYEEGGSVSLRLTNLDSDFNYVSIAFVSVVDDAVQTGISGLYEYNGTELNITVSGLKSGEISLDEILVQSLVYTKAKTLTLQGNRLYMGNLETADSSDLQQYANRIQVVYKSREGAQTGFDGSDEVYFSGNDAEADFHFGGLAFQPGEVYAFYVSYVREDGSLTPAFHIPGPPPRVINQSHLTAIEAVGSITDTHSSLVTAASGSLDYLQSDAAIATNIRYFHTRNTHEEFSSSSAYMPTNQTDGIGYCGVYENQNETYPSGFPVQRWTVENIANNTGSITDYTLAGEQVRHHKIPLFDGNQTMVRIKFVNIPQVDGYVGVRFYYAQRDLTNSLHIGQSALLHGSANYYADTMGVTADGYDDYISSTGMNLPQLNHTLVIGTGNQVDPVPNNTDQLSDARFFSGVKENTGRMYCFEALRTRVNLPDTAYIENVDMRVTYGTNATAGELLGNGLVTDYQDLSYFGDPDILTVPSYLTLAGRTWELNTGRQVAINDNVRIRKVSDVRYVESSAVDDVLEFDNRFGSACIGMNIDHVNTTLRDSWRTAVKGTAVTFNNAMSNPGLGYFMNNGLTAGKIDEAAANPVWVSNLKQHLDNCYFNYADQTLVACTAVVPYTNMQTAELGQVANESVDVATVDTTLVTGDIVRSLYLHRITAPIGVDKVKNTQNTNIIDLLSLATVGTIDFERGAFSHRYYYAVQGKTKYRYNTYREDHEYNLTLKEYAQDRDVSPENDTDYTYPAKYYSENTYQPVGVYSAAKSFIQDYPHRIARSTEIGNLGVSTQVIAFKPVEFYDMQRDRGEIQNLQGYGDRLLIHHERGLFLTQGQERIATTAGELALGQADVFATKPVEIRPSDKGYAGTQHLLSCVLTPHGYFFVDQAQRKVFSLAGTDLQEISRSGMKDWFERKLERLSNNPEISDNIYQFYSGLQATYDSRYDRVVLLIRNNESTATWNPGNWPETQTEYNATVVAQVDEVISWSYLNKSWISRHSYDNTAMLSGLNNVYSIRVKQINDNGLKPQVVTALMHNQAGTFGKFHGVVHESTIDASIPTGKAAIFSSFDWDTRVVDFPEERYTHYSRTFTKAMVYTDTHCSGLVDLVTPVGTTTGHNLRHTHERWHFNGFRDLVNNRTLPFLTEDLEVITSNINNLTEWYNQRRMQSDYAVIRLYIKNQDSGDEGIGLYLYDIGVKARLTPRG